MAKIKLKGNPINTVGSLPQIGAQAPDFRLTTAALADVALKDFAGKKAVTTSSLRNDDFGSAYGVRITEGGMAGLLSRAVVILDESGKVIYTGQVPEITQEPDYAAALKALK